MNKRKRTILQGAGDMIDRAIELVSGVKDEEEVSLDNLSQRFEDTEMYGNIEDAVDALEDALDDLNSAREAINKAVDIRMVT